LLKKANKMGNNDFNSSISAKISADVAIKRIKRNGLTELKFTHEGLTPEVECFKDCKPGWTHWIKTSLFSYFTTKKGDFNQPRN